MSDPLIRCIMPTCNRESLALRAMFSCQRQSYGNVQLIVWNSGGYAGVFNADRTTEVSARADKGKTTGFLRNAAIEFSQFCGARVPDYVAHFDDDDVSAPDRLSHQLAHIQKTGKLVTGYYDMPMYDAKNDKVWIYSDPAKRYILGTSLFYKREAWERVKFPDRTPEDNLWRKQVGGENCEPQSVFRDGVPMMVQTVHGGNASARISLNPKGIPTSKRFREPSEAEEKAVRELLRA